MKVDPNQIVKPTEKPVRLFTRNFVLITIINFATFASNQMFNAALPPYLQGLGTPATLLGFFTAVATIVTLVFRPFIGLWLDRTGRRLIFMIGLAGLLLVSIGYGLTPMIAVIFAIRALHGLVWAAGSTAISTIATDNIPKKRFGEGVAYFGLANSLAIAVAPAIALSLAFSNMILVSYFLLASALILAFFMRDNDQRHLPTERAAVAKPVRKGDLMEKTAVLPALIIVARLRRLRRRHHLPGDLCR